MAQETVDAVSRARPDNRSVPLAWRNLVSNKRRLIRSSAGIGFAVLGGAFAEGIDLPGRRLVGAFIATLGLPPPSAATEILRRRMDSAFGEGYAYAYLYQEFRR